MRIVNFVAENFKRINVVEITPEGALVDVQGRNGQGKTSVLDAIWAALGGKEAEPGEPIRKGEQSSTIKLTLGEGEKVDYVVTRKYTRKADGGHTTQLHLDSADGSRHAKPQTILDSLFGPLSIDPLLFMRMDAKEQVQQLRSLVPDVDFEALDGANRRDYDTRTEVNREEKSLRARLEVMRVPGDPNQKRVDEMALVAELEQAGEKMVAIEAERRHRLDEISSARADVLRAEKLRSDNADRRLEIERLQAEIEAAEKLADSYQANAQRIQKEQEALPPLDLPPDTASIKARIDAARKINGEVDARERVIKERVELQQQAAAAKKRSDELTEAMEARTNAKAAAVAAAKLPIDGLTFEDDVVMYRGLPLKQASDAEQLKVSVAIAAAMHPKLKIVRIRDGSLLDDDSVKEVAAFAEKYGMQIWREVVASNAKSGIILEDGRLKTSTEQAA